MMNKTDKLRKLYDILKSLASDFLWVCSET